MEIWRKHHLHIISGPGSNYSIFCGAPFGGLVGPVRSGAAEFSKGGRDSLVVLFGDLPALQRGSE